jgi:hypothetical protein
VLDLLVVVTLVVRQDPRESVRFGLVDPGHRRVGLRANEFVGKTASVGERRVDAEHVRVEDASTVGLESVGVDLHVEAVVGRGLGAVEQEARLRVVGIFEGLGPLGPDARDREDSEQGERCGCGSSAALSARSEHLDLHGGPASVSAWGRNGRARLRRNG